MSNILEVSRSENKYIINELDVISLKDKLSKFMIQDKNNIEGGYMVRSLYFDSINNIDYLTKLAGTDYRKKIRIRVYNINHNKCKLELKEKKGELQKKTSVWITKEDAIELTACNYGVLTKYFEKSEEYIYIYKLMVLGCYKPTTLVEYNRLAYIYPEFDTRVTLDMNVRSNESNFDLFSKNPNYTSVLENTILEVKYNEKLMKFISDILKNYRLTKVAVSKYCLGRKNFEDFIF